MSAQPRKARGGKQAAVVRPTKLRAMTGKASAAKAAAGDAPVIACIASLPQPQRRAAAWMKQAATTPFFGGKKK
jgi:hypothetical protein